MKLWIGGGEIDQVIGMGEDSLQFAALTMPQESGDLFLLQRASEPLHVVLHENLHGGALDRASALDGHVHTAADRHMGAEKDCGFRIADRGLTACQTP